MTGFFKNTRKRLAQHRAYRDTVRELRALPIQVKMDLDIIGAEEKLASKAVYGA